MPETRYQTIETYQDNEIIATEKIPYEVSDEELEKEEAENTIAQLSALTDAELTTTDIKQLIKALVKLRR
jgi:hypothetical protein